MLVEEEDDAVEAQEILPTESTSITTCPEMPQRFADGGGFIQGHTNVELVAFDKLSPHKVALELKEQEPTTC